MSTVIITIEKITLPILKKALKGKISVFQFAGRQNSDCNLAKLRMLYMNKKFNHDRTLLVDIQKAYDSVDLSKLQIIIQSYLPENSRVLASKMVELYKSITISFKESEIFPTKGLPQGSSWAMYLFCLYINPTLDLISTRSSEVHIQAYVDDLVISSTSVDKIQSSFAILEVNLSKVDLSINPGKCEFISSIENEEVLSASNTLIKAQPQITYLGQSFNSRGEPTTSISNKFFRSLYGVLATTSGVSVK